VFSLENANLRRLWRRTGFVATLEGTIEMLGFAAPRDVKQLWNKGRGIWFPRWVGSLRSGICGVAAGLMRIFTPRQRRGLAPVAVARTDELIMSAGGPRRGDWTLSAKKRSDTEDTGHSGNSTKPPASARAARKHRSGDLGRALRSVYDDTLREHVPDEFLSLLGKLQ
jgi:hypothetical protein